MKRHGAHIALALLCVMSFAGCKEEKVFRKALIQDLPVGYEVENTVYDRNDYKKPKTTIDVLNREIGMDMQIPESQIVRKKDEKEEMEAVQQDVRLYSWKSKPKTFVHLEEEVVEEVKKNKKSR